MTRRVSSVAVVGRDAPLWLTAAAIQRSVGRLGVSVRAIELPSLLQAADVYSAMPAIQALNKQIGLKEEVVMAVAKAVPLVAQRYSNWIGALPPFMLGYDDPPPPGSDVGFINYWTKGRQGGLKLSFEEFSLAVAAAKHGRVPQQEKQACELSATYGYNLAAAPYSKLVKSFAEGLGVATEVGIISEVEVKDGRIVAAGLTSGSRVEAELFIDASGVEGALIGRLPGDHFESWKPWLPCDRLIVASGGPINPPPVFSQISAFKAGWVGVYPLQDRTAVVAVYNSRHVSDREVVDSVPLLARVQIGSEAVASPIRPGVRRQSWIGNCVAIGEAAIALDPLESFSLHVTHTCISHLMAFFPVEVGSFPEADLYNRTIALAGENLRDIQCAHYRFNRRFDEPFWDRCREMDLPESLDRKSELFSLNAQIPICDEEPFEEQHWAALFAGAGIMPEGYDPRIDMASDEVLIGKVQQRLRDIATTVPSMPSASEFLETSRESLEVAR